ncbi:MAG: hypothetical protein M1608_09365 [Candidatus Omnitrophica bacterium]|nr:hypothetical protein [Candidatus Omnitrophota bacterium]
MRWTWLGAADPSEPGRKLVDALYNLEANDMHPELDREVLCQFFAGLPEGICREIHAYLHEPKFSHRLADLHSAWHRIQHEYEGRFDPSAHLRSCEENLGRDWHYGQPLIANAVSRQDLATAEHFVELTLSSLLRGSREAPWQPEQSLLPKSQYYRAEEEDQAILKLLDQWKDIAAKRGKPERVANLRFQRVVLQSPEDWAAVLAASEEYQSQPVDPAVAAQLFAEWRQRIAIACTQQESESKPATDTWVHRLIDVQRNPSSNQNAFIEYAEIWLECCQKHAAFFEKNWRSLALLTRNLPLYRETQARCPTFHSHVLVEALHVSADLEKSIRQALALLGNRATRVQVQPVWEQHLHTLVPSPGGNGASYQGSALWMKALSEVNPTDYGVLLSRWKTAFGRRRNLWREMASMRCPGL